jgi:hypothetical protein
VALYLVGAGLTKSLQQTRSVPLVMDFTRVLAESITNDVVLNTLVTILVTIFPPKKSASHLPKCARHP